jgi:hypothetical protein
MKTMNNILKMISKLESNANDVKLGKHEVQLAEIVSDPKIFEKGVFNIYSNANKYADKLKNDIVGNYQAEYKKIFEIQKEHSKNFEIIRNKAKELGIDIATTQLGKDYLKVGSYLSDIAKNTLDQQVKWGTIKP